MADISTFLHRRDKDTLGSYSDSLFITLSPKVPAFHRNKAMRINAGSSLEYACLVHEHWHYWLNISTASRLRDMQYLQHVVVNISQTIPDNGTLSLGKEAIPDERLKMIDALRTAKLHFDGHVGLPSAKIDDWKIKRIRTLKPDLLLEGQFLPLEDVLLDVEYETIFNLSVSTTYQFGQIAIEESLVGELTKIIHRNATMPAHPYGTARKIAEHYGLRDLGRYELACLCTLAMVTLNPPLSLLRIFEEYPIHRNRLNLRSGLESLWTANSSGLEEVFDIFDHQTAEMVKRYDKRGASEYAARYLRRKITQASNRRRENPIFDLLPFENDTPDFVKLEEFLREFPACCIVQEFEGEADTVEKDVIVQHPDILKAGGSPEFVGEFLVALSCQLDFAVQHAVNGYPKPEDLTCTCPFYTSCTNRRRVATEAICRTKPWCQFEPDEEEHCWYGAGILALRSAGNASARGYQPIIE